MFIQNKYYKWYFKIINSARQNHTGYFERHHIIPKSLGGSNKKDNLVKLTPKEHYICHLLLIKMVDDPVHKSKMVYAFNIMAGKPCGKKDRYTSSLYTFFRTTYGEQLSKEQHPRFGKKLTDDHKAILREKTLHQWRTSDATKSAKRGFKWTDAQKEARSKSFKGKIWVTNFRLNQTKMIRQEELDQFINDGWERGRKINNPFSNSGTNFR